MPVSVEEALQLIYENVQATSSEIVPIESALGRVLSQNVEATHNLPPFDNSAMDGYAVTMGDAGRIVKVVHTTFAGDAEEAKVFDGSVVKIMTGAKIPEGCEAIIPVENTTEDEDGLKLPEHFKAGQHIRLCGEDIQSGDMLLHSGEQLHAHHITLLASQGVTHVHVRKRPKISLFASGSELKMHFETVESYQLYNTNTPTFMARCEELECEVSFTGTPEDSLEAITQHIESSKDADLIITSGGVSIGDADFTKEAFKKAGMQSIFEKVNIKPGKPTTFGRMGNTFVLNLPGNPLAAALNFELFAQSIILALSGNAKRYLGTVTAQMHENFKHKAGRRSLIPGYFDGTTFKPCEKFSPGMISPLAISNGFIMIDESVESLEEGKTVKVIPTRFGLYQNSEASLVTS